MQIYGFSTNASKSIALDMAGFMIKSDKKPVVMCVGCDRIVGDSLAPMVGEFLKVKYNVNTYVYGDFDYNITAQNIVGMVDRIKTWHCGCPIIVVDATLGALDEVGFVKYYPGGCYPASVFSHGVGKVGDYTILGVVGEKLASKEAFMHGINLKIVSTLADVIARSIALAYKYSMVIT